ncbi:transposase and inactivated derivative, partial [Paenibacillus popilliae ATCC 14706]
MKDELEYKECTSIDELRIRINEYIHFYNTGRYQWTLKKMTPNQYEATEELAFFFGGGADSIKRRHSPRVLEMNVF